eukprot:1291737-Lingulodinium_polyedra.AAC.1
MPFLAWVSCPPRTSVLKSSSVAWGCLTSAARAPSKDLNTARASKSSSSGTSSAPTAMPELAEDAPPSPGPSGTAPENPSFLSSSSSH